MNDILIVLSPIAGLAVNSVLLILICRSRPTFSLLKAEYTAFAAGALFVFGFDGFICLIYQNQTFATEAGHMILALASYAALGYCHFHFVNLGETARRIRLLRELYRARGRLPHAELLSCYNAGEIVGKRITRLINSGQIILSNERYFIGNNTVVKIAQFILLLKILLLGKTSEHEK